MATDDLEQLRKRAEELEQMAIRENEKRELKKRIKLAKADLRKDTLVAQIFTGLKKKAGKAVDSALN